MYRRVRVAPEALGIARCYNCEWMDLELTPAERHGFPRVGSRIWKCNGRVISKVADYKYMFCSLTGNSCSADDRCPGHRFAREMWISFREYKQMRDAGIQMEDWDYDK